MAPPKPLGAVAWQSEALELTSVAAAPLQTRRQPPPAPTPHAESSTLPSARPWRMWTSLRWS
eukprot:4998962-Pleurochrysis_carterae.AAC.1